jgi:hypothetical protein
VRRLWLLALIVVLGLTAGAQASVSGARPAPLLSHLSVSSANAFGGDNALLATVSPNGDGYRDDARIRFFLRAAADVSASARSTDPTPQKLPQPQWVYHRHLAKGWHTLLWQPQSTLAPATYVIAVRTSTRSAASVYGRLGRRSAQPPGPIVRVLGVDAVFDKSSYAPGEVAHLRVSTDASALTLRVVDVAGSETQPQETALDGPTVFSAAYDWGLKRDRGSSVDIPVGNWTSGVYFARVTADDGRVGYAPFVVKATKHSRVAVLIADRTWSAYNFYDANNDGFADSWYAGGPWSTSLARPYMHNGIPWGFWASEWPTLRWLRLHHVTPDFLAESDLEAYGVTLSQHYDLVVVPSHFEYATYAEFGALERYRDDGGDLIFLASNNLFWKVNVSGSVMTKVGQWRALGHPESWIVGTQYAGSQDGDQGPYTITDSPSATWAFAGTGLASGDTFGNTGTEFDTITRYSPPNTHVLAYVRTDHHLGQMTYYQKGNAKVFAAGTFLQGSVLDSVVSRLLENIWARSDAPPLSP